MISVNAGLNVSLINVRLLSLMLLACQSLYSPASLQRIPKQTKGEKTYTFPNGSICAASRIYALKIKKKEEEDRGDKEQGTKKKKDKKSTFSYLRPLTPPSLTCLTPVCCHPHSNVFHHNVLCKSQDDSSWGGSEGQEVTAGGGRQTSILASDLLFILPALCLYSSCISQRSCIRLKRPLAAIWQQEKLWGQNLRVSPV